MGKVRFNGAILACLFSIATVGWGLRAFPRQALAFIFTLAPGFLCCSRMTLVVEPLAPNRFGDLQVFWQECEFGVDGLPTEHLIADNHACSMFSQGGKRPWLATNN